MSYGKCRSTTVSAMGHRTFQGCVFLLWALVPNFTASALTNGLALTPPMGWNGWLAFYCGVNETIVKQNADAMATNGMKAAGYQYINLDDCWGYRSNGVLVVNTNNFPDGIQSLANYVHADGLKFGIYRCIGSYTNEFSLCSLSNEVTDANTFASWGVDYLKDDSAGYCIDGSSVTEPYYVAMGNALLGCGRPIVLNACTCVFYPWLPTYANQWRTTTDSQNTWSTLIGNLDANNPWYAAAGPGNWNDPDMLSAGNVNDSMSATEDQSQFAMWCIVAAPLIVSTDLRSISQTTLNILTNAEAIAIDQDSNGVQGVRVSSILSTGGTVEVWCKPVGTDGTTKAVALFNRSAVSTNMTANWSDISLQPGNATVRDLWAHTNVGTFTDSFSTNVPSHGVALLKIIGTPMSRPSPPLWPLRIGTNYVSDLYWIYQTNGFGNAQRDMSNGECDGGD
ncbi:MAG: hypothetical protein ACLPT4_15655, partial [Verrucomicrobiia bacterium]